MKNRKKMHLNIIGAGKLGKTLGKLFIDHGVAKIAGIVNSTEQSSQEAIAFIGQGTAFTTISALPQAELTLISTPDDALKVCARQLLDNPLLNANSAVIHCSGSLNSHLFSMLKPKTGLIGSIHPLHSFANPALSIHQFKGAFCTLEGNEQILPLLSQWVKAIGGQPVMIETSEKPLYHAASVFASNYVIALAEIAHQLLTQSGINAETAQAMISHLMQSAVSNLARSKNIASALTGPIQRGDYSTVEKHLSSIKTADIQQLYRQLGQVCLDMGKLDSNHRQRLKALFSPAQA